MTKVRHWWWHFVAMVLVCDMTRPDIVTDAEFDAYKRFMARHGFSGCP